MSEFRRGVVTSVEDPQDYGRIRARVNGFAEQHSETPWAWPCSPLAGGNWGFFMLPEVGDEVWLVRSHEGDWIYLGYFWSDRKPKPADGSPTARVLRTPSGHLISLSDSGSVLIQTASGSKIELKAGGDIDIMAAGNINLNGSDGGGVVCKQHICSATGYSHAQASSTVKGKK